MQLPYTKKTLGNGLDVIVHEDHQLPMVAVNIWYHVGSKNERPGRTGFAHLFEHLMFEGSEHHDHGFFPPLQRAGGLLNGSTSMDRTNYWEVVPTGALELALWMESDRMGYLLPALTDAKFNNQRDVVINERRQNYENRPYGLANMALSATMYPPEHPYHWLTIGSAEDLRATTLDEVHAFFKTYYHPANASLSLAGDIDTGEAFELAERFFGDLAPGPVPAPTDPAGRAERRVPGRPQADRAPRARVRAGPSHPGRDVDALRRPVPGACHRPRPRGAPGRARARREPGGPAGAHGVALALDVEPVRLLRARLERGGALPDHRRGVRGGTAALRPRSPGRPGRPVVRPRTPAGFPPSTCGRCPATPSR